MRTPKRTKTKTLPDHSDEAIEFADKPLVHGLIEAEETTPTSVDAQPTLLMHAETLGKLWDTPEEDEAWKHLQEE